MQDPSLAATGIDVSMVDVSLLSAGAGNGKRQHDQMDDDSSDACDAELDRQAKWQKIEGMVSKRNGNV